MKTKFRGLTLTALLLSASNMTFAEQGATSAVGDLPGYGEEAYFAEEATYAQPNPVQAVGHSGDSAIAQSYVGSEPEQYEPVGVGDLQQVGHHYGGTACSSGYCDGGCDSGCDSGCRSSCRRRPLRAWLDDVEDAWATTELLLWFVQDRDMPPLITTAPAGQAPILGLPNTNVVFGDDINGELSAGFRLDVGKYLSDNIGIGGRFWILAENNDSYFANSDGTDMSIGRPFFNTDTRAEDALLVSAAGVFTGAIAAESSLDIWGAEAYTRMRFGCTKDCKLDFIGGYSHFEVDDELRISSTTVTNATARTRTYNDLIDAENKFDGGQLGFEMAMTRGRWRASSLTKVHLGNMNQRVRLLGNAFDETPPIAGTTTAGGLLTLDNQVVAERDVFAFVPEANFKLAYQLRCNLLFSVGYSFLYFDNVALAGDLVDRSADATALNTNNAATRPAFNFDDSSLWVQGIDLGLVWDF